MYALNAVFFLVVFLGFNISFFLSGFEAQATLPKKSPALAIFHQGRPMAVPGMRDLRFRLARNLEYGTGVPRDHEGAINAYLEAANMGSDQALVAVATYYLYGKNGKKYNYNNCFEILSHAVQISPNDDARVLLGLCFFRGIGVEKNFPKAFSYFRQSVALPLAKHMLALCYEFAIGTPKNLEEAQRLRNLTFAELNKPGLSDYSAEIKFALGYSYLNGYGCDVNFNNGIKLIEASARDGNLFATHYLGFCYEYGFGVKRDEEKSRNCFLESARHKDTNAFLEPDECRIEGIRVASLPLAFTYKVQESNHEKVALLASDESLDQETGATPILEKGVGMIDDDKQDSHQLFKSFQIGAKRSDPKDMFQLARLYETKSGIPDDMRLKSPEFAAQWYIKAAEAGLVEAMYNAGVCLETGYGLPGKNFDQAFQWYLAAAEANFAPAQFACGDCYLLGRGIQKNIQKALFMWSKASENNYGKAFVMLGDYAYHIAHNARDAVKYYMKAIEIGEPKGCFAVAHFLENGIGFQKDSVKALQWVTLAAIFSSDDKQKAVLKLPEVIKVANPIWDDARRGDDAGPAMDTGVALDKRTPVKPIIPIRKSISFAIARTHSYSVGDDFKALEERTTQLSDLAGSGLSGSNKGQNLKSRNCSCCAKKGDENDYDYRRVEDGDGSTDVDSSRKRSSYCSRCCCVLL